MRSSSLAHLSRKQFRFPRHLLLFVMALFLLALTSSSAPAQETAAQEKRAVEESSAAGSITGRVTGEDGRPAVDVQVLLYGVVSGMSGRTGLTDSAGRFQFKELPPGFYGLRATAASFIELPDENRTPWEPKYFKPGDTAQLTLVKGGVITGTILTAQGDPVAGANVRAIRVRDAQGRRLPMESSPSAMPRMTDDRGVYRIYGLLPGSYLVVVGGNNPYYFGGTGLYHGDIPTYFPSSTRDTAAEVAVRAGEEATGVDIRYRGDRGHTISGAISGVDNRPGRFGIGVVLMRVGTGLFEGQTYALEVGGKRVFSLTGIPDGEYELVIQAYFEQGDAVASAPRRVTVRGADVTGLQLELAPLASIAGRVTLEPLSSEGACAKTSVQTAMLQTLIMARREEQDQERLQPAIFSAGGAVPKEQGEFLIRNLAGGHFRLNIRMPGDDWYLRAISFPPATRPAAAEARPADAKVSALPSSAPQAATGIVAVKRGERASGINITLAQGAASLLGRVVAQAEGAAVPANLRVYLVPVERERADDILRYAETGLAADGSFTFTSLAPGRYLLVVRRVAPQTDMLKPPRMLAWDEEARKALRREAEAANNALELKPCQQLKDYSLSYAVK